MAYKKFLFFSDVHGDEVDEKAIKVCLDFKKEWKPDFTICGGDQFDFRPLRGKASEAERRQSLVDDFAAGQKWFNAFNPTYYLRGNHCERLWDLAARETGIMQDAALGMISQIDEMVAKHKCEMRPYDKRIGILKLGELSFLHGFHCGIHADKQAVLVYGGNGSTIMGHVHADSSYPIAGLTKRIGMSVGCLCNLDMEFEARRPGSLRHCHGFAYGVINEKTGKFQVWKAAAEDGKWLLCNDFKEYL